VCEIQEITGYAGDIYAFVAETAGALKDDEAIPDDLVDELISPTSMPKLPPGVDLSEATSSMIRLKPNGGR